MFVLTVEMSRMELSSASAFTCIAVIIADSTTFQGPPSKCTLPYLLPEWNSPVVGTGWALCYMINPREGVLFYAKRAESI